MLTKTAKIEGGEMIILIPSKNKALVRISDGLRIIGMAYLGFTYYLGGRLLDKPHWEVPDDYTEEDMTEEELKQLEEWESF